MTDEEKQTRALHMYQDEMNAAEGKPSWFYLSYADENGFRGGTYVQGFGPVSAAMHSSQHGLSPGGQVRIFPIPDDAGFNIPEAAKYRLLSREELEKLHEMKSERELMEEENGG